LPTGRWLEIIDEAAETGVEQVFVLGGGEPLLRKDTPQLLQRIKRHGMRGMLTTNGTLLTPELIEQLIDTEWDEIHFSVDGPTPEIHDKLRGQDGAFRRTIQAACRLAVQKRRRGAAKPLIALHFVLTNQNWDQLLPMVELAEAIGAQRVDFDSLVAYRPEQKALELDREQLVELPGLARAAQHRAGEAGIETTLDNFIQEKRVERGYKLPVGGEEKGMAGAPCLKAWHHLVVQADGRTSPCCVLAGEGGSARETSLEQIWSRDPFLLEVRSKMESHSPLSRCRECSWNILRHEAEIRSHLAGGRRWQ
jgi:AdoMet-dependent heme synthase